MSISVIIPRGLQVFTGNTETIEVTGSTIGECLDDLVAHYPDIEDPIFFEEGKLWTFGHNRVSLFLNGEDTGPDCLSLPVNDGDTIHIILAISGG